MVARFYPGQVEGWHWPFVPYAVHSPHGTLAADAPRPDPV